jgi:hypothetical protein
VKGAKPVIALTAFTDAKGVHHPYGAEFPMGDTSERAALLEKGTIRIDDRMVQLAPESSAAPAKGKSRTTKE